MSMAHEFDYLRPSGLTEALKQKAEHRERAEILAGGTDLIVNIKEGMKKPHLLIDIKDIPELQGLEYDGSILRIGAVVTFAALINSPEVRNYFPLLHDAARTVASTGVRSRATLVGNICSAVPSLDAAPPLLCYDAVVHCASVAGNRDLPIGEWFLAPRQTALHADELVTGVSLTVPAEKSGGIYLKLGRYGGEDLAQAGWGIQVSSNLQYRIAHCALAPKPARAQRIEQLLNNHELSTDLIAQAIALIPTEINPITDIRSSREYRLHISGVMLKRGLYAAWERLQGKEIDAQKLLGGLA